MIARTLTLALLVSLAACSGANDPGADDRGGGDAATNASSEEATTATEPVPDNAMIDPQNTVVPIPAATPSPVVATAMPAAYRGRWGMVPNDCDPARADAKGLMTVSADRLAFYESRAVPGAIRVTSPTSLSADLAFSGEGQTWRQTVTLTLADDGKTLIREKTAGEGDEVGAQRYSRCPGDGPAR